MKESRLNDIIFKFYSLIPSYLRNKRKLRKSDILTLEQKGELMGGV